MTQTQLFLNKLRGLNEKKTRTEEYFRRLVAAVIFFKH